MKFGSEYFNHYDPLGSEMNIESVNFHSNISKYDSKNHSGKKKTKLTAKILIISATIIVK